jgi:hypothetical protein
MIATTIINSISVKPIWIDFTDTTPDLEITTVLRALKWAFRFTRVEIPVFLNPARRIGLRSQKSELHLRSGSARSHADYSGCEMNLPLSSRLSRADCPIGGESPIGTVNPYYVAEAGFTGRGTQKTRPLIE